MSERDGDAAELEPVSLKRTLSEEEILTEIHFQTGLLRRRYPDATITVEIEPETRDDGKAAWNATIVNDDGSTVTESAEA